ncbi:MAG: TM1266 family iron-only hydrogenase system putative regulator [Kiritimatiellia bacterium]
MEQQPFRRTGFVGIILEDRERLHTQVNELLASVHGLIVARLGLPACTGGSAVITLVVSATPDELGALTGRLGQIQGVTVKSALAPLRK